MEWKNFTYSLVKTKTQFLVDIVKMKRSIIFVYNFDSISKKTARKQFHEEVVLCMCLQTKVCLARCYISNYCMPISANNIFRVKLRLKNKLYNLKY